MRRETKVRVISFVFIVLALAGCGEKNKPAVTAIQNAGAIPDQESWKSRIVFSDSGLTRAIVNAEHIRMYEARRETLLDSGLVVHFYSMSGVHTSKLTALRGRVDDATKDLEAFDNVVFSSDSGTVVRTEYLFWDHDTRRVRSDRFVTVTSPKERLQGYGFEADQGLKNYVIYRVSLEAEVEK